MLHSFYKKLLIAFIVLFAFFALFPLLFKNTLIKLFFKKMHHLEQLTAAYQHVDLYWGRSFPDFTFWVKDFELTGTNQYADEKMCMIPHFKCAIDFWSLIFKKEIKIKKIDINDAIINLVKQNQTLIFSDLFAIKDHSENLIFSPELIKIKNSHISFKDRDNNTEFVMSDISQVVRRAGGLANNTFEVVLKAQDVLLAKYNVDYISGVELNAKMQIRYDNTTNSYFIEPSEALFNDLLLKYEGEFSFEKGNKFFNIDAVSHGNIKRLASLFNYFYLNDYDKFTGKGTYSLNFDIGITDNFSADNYYVSLRADSCDLKYDFMPSGLSNICIDVLLSKIDEDDGSIFVNFGINADDNSFNTRLYQSAEIDKKIFEGFLKTHINLAALSNIIPENRFADMGHLLADMGFSGTYSPSYPELNTVSSFGNMHIGQMIYNNNTENMPVYIDTAILAFNDNKLVLKHFKSRFGTSELHAEGLIHNFINALMTKETLLGEWQLFAPVFNMQNIMKSEMQFHENGDTLITHISGFDVPANMRMKVIFKADVFNVGNDLALDGMNAVFDIDNKSLFVRRINAGVNGGKALLRGFYRNTYDEEMSFYFTNDYENVSISDVIRLFPDLNSTFPELAHTVGKINTTFDISYNKGFEHFMRNHELLSAPSAFYNELINCSDLAQIQWYLALRMPSLEMLEVAFFINLAEKVGIEMLKNTPVQDISLRIYSRNGQTELKAITFKVGDVLFEGKGFWNNEHKLNTSFDMSVPVSHFSGAALTKLNALALASGKQAKSLLNQDLIVFHVLINPIDESLAISLQ